VLVAHTSARAGSCGGISRFGVPCTPGCLRTPLLLPAEPERCDQRALRHRPQARDAAGAGCPPHLHHRLSHSPQPEGLPQERGVSPPPTPHATVQPFSVYPPCIPAHSPCVTGVLPATCRDAEHEKPWEPLWSGLVAHGLGSNDTQPLVPPRGWGRPPHADIQQHTAALAGLAGIFAASPGSFPWEPRLFFRLASKARRRHCGCVISARHQAVQPWLSPPAAPGGPKSIRSPSAGWPCPVCAGREQGDGTLGGPPREVQGFAWNPLSLHECEWELGSAAEPGPAAWL